MLFVWYECISVKSIVFYFISTEVLSIFPVENVRKHFSEEKRHISLQTSVTHISLQTSASVFERVLFLKFSEKAVIFFKNTRKSSKKCPFLLKI